MVTESPVFHQPSQSSSLDGHSSHFNPEAIAVAAKEKIAIFCRPPHTTHIAQPLDVSFFFGPLKQHWARCAMIILVKILAR